MSIKPKSHVRTRVPCICSRQLTLRVSFVLPTMASASTSKQVHNARNSRLFSDTEKVYGELANCSVEAIAGSIPDDSDTAYAVRLAREEATLRQQFDIDRAFAASLQDNTDSSSSSVSNVSVHAIQEQPSVTRTRSNMGYVHDPCFTSAVNGYLTGL